MFTYITKFQLTIIDFILGLVTSLVIGYVLVEDFRAFVFKQEMDPTMLASMVTFLALLATIRQNYSLSKQSVRDRNFAYRLSVKSKFEDMGVILVSKLLEIESRRLMCVSTIENIKLCMDSDREYRDGYNITSTETFNSDSCRASAALDIYFPEQSEKWNEILSTLNEMGSLASSILLTYNKNDYGRIPTKLLNDIDIHLSKVRTLNEAIGNKPQEIREGVVEQINHRTLDLTVSYPN